MRWSACTTTCTRPTTGTCCAAGPGSSCTTCAWARATDGATEVIDLDGDVDQGVYIPPGVAHGFAALTDLLLWYLVDKYYNAADELGLAWDDPDVGRGLGGDRPDPLARGTRATPDAPTSPTKSGPAWRLSAAASRRPARGHQVHAAEMPAPRSC